MNDQEVEELQEALRPIASLISKSEKVRQKLSSGTWQHAMLKKNIKALHIASVLMNKEAEKTEKVTRNELEEAMHALADMVSRTEKSQSKFLPGTSQHTLQRNRLNALRMAEALTKLELDSRNA